MSNPNAYSRFKTTHADAVKLLPTTTSSFEPSDLDAHRCRYALVLGVASMDSYFTRKFTNKLTDFLKVRGVTKGLSKYLTDAKVDTEFFLRLLCDDTKRPFRKIHTKISRRLDQYTSLSVSKIDELYRAFEIDDLCSLATNRAKKAGHLEGFRSPMVRLEKVVQRRHQIVHTSDFNAHGQYYKIEAKRTLEDLNLILGFVAGAEEVIEEKFKS